MVRDCRKICLMKLDKKEPPTIARFCVYKRVCDTPVAIHIQGNNQTQVVFFCVVQRLLYIYLHALANPDRNSKNSHMTVINKQ